MLHKDEIVSLDFHQYQKKLNNKFFLKDQKIVVRLLNHSF